jgi:FtsH-binding integral membrane protein
MTDLRLVSNGRARRLSGPEIAALTKERVAARLAYFKDQHAQREAEESAWRRQQARRLRIKTGIIFALAVLLAIVASYCAATNTHVWLGLVCTSVLTVGAIYAAFIQQAPSED